jgi:hypothetical protein
MMKPLKFAPNNGNTVIKPANTTAKMPTSAVASSFLRIHESIYTYIDSGHLFSLNWFILLQNGELFLF